MFEGVNNLKIDFENTTGIKDIPESEKRSFNEVVFECLEDCKPFVRQGKEEDVFAAIDKEIKVQWLREYLRNLLNRVMFGFNSLSPLREMQNNDFLTLFNLVNDIFENCIIRTDIIFSEKYEDYGLDSEETMNDIIVTFRTLVRFYVIHRYAKNSIIIDFSEETGLNETVAKIVAEAIDKNFSHLQMSLLLEQMASK